MTSVERCREPSTANNGSGSEARVSLDSAQPASCRIRVAMQGAPLGEPLASPGNSGSRADPVSLSLGSPGVHSGISSLWRTVSGKVRGGELSRRPSWWSEDLEQSNTGVDARKTPRGTPRAVGSGSQRRSISGADDPSRTPPWSPRPSLRRMATVSSLQTLHPAASLKPPQRAPASSAPLTPSIDPWADIDSDTLEGIIADESEPLLERYRAMSMLSDRSRRSRAAARSLGSELEHRDTPSDTPMAASNSSPAGSLFHRGKHAEALELLQLIAPQCSGPPTPAPSSSPRGLPASFRRLGRGHLTDGAPDSPAAVLARPLLQ